MPLLGTLDPDAPIISFSSLSKAYLAPGWRTGWMVVGAHAAPRRRAGGDEEAGGRPAVQPGPMQYAVDRGADRRPLAPGRVPRGARRARAADHDEMLNAIPGHALRRAARGVLRDADGRRCRRAAPTRTTSWRCCARPACCACYGSGFGMPPEAGVLPHRVPRRARASSQQIYADIGGVHARLPRATASTLSRRRRRRSARADPLRASSASR